MPRKSESERAWFRVPDPPELPLKERVKRDDFLTYVEAAGYLHCSPDTIRRRVSEGRLNKYKPAGQQKPLIRAMDLHDFMREGLVS